MSEREYLVKAHLALDALHREMNAAGLSESAVADLLCDMMDLSWHGLTDDEQDRVKAAIVERAEVKG